MPYVGSHIDTYIGEILQDESRALFQEYEPGMPDYLGNRVVRHRQTNRPD